MVSGSRNAVSPRHVPHDLDGTCKVPFYFILFWKTADRHGEVRSFVCQAGGMINTWVCVCDRLEVGGRISEEETSPKMKFIRSVVKLYEKHLELLLAQHFPVKTAFIVFLVLVYTTNSFLSHTVCSVIREMAPSSGQHGNYMASSFLAFLNVISNMLPCEHANLFWNAKVMLEKLCKQKF